MNSRPGYYTDRRVTYRSIASDTRGGTPDGGYTPSTGGGSGSSAQASTAGRSALAPTAGSSTGTGTGHHGGRINRGLTAARRAREHAAHAARNARGVIARQKRAEAHQRAMARHAAAAAKHSAAAHRASNRASGKGNVAKAPNPHQAMMDARRTQMDAARERRQAAADARRQAQDTNRTSRQHETDARRQAHDATQASQRTKTEAHQAAAEARRQVMDQQRAERQRTSDAARTARTALQARHAKESQARQRTQDQSRAQRQAAADARRQAADAARAAKQNAPKPAKTPKPAPAQFSQNIVDAVQRHSSGETLTAADQGLLIRNGLAHLDKSGNLILTHVGQGLAKHKSSFAVFKDARGEYRWVAASSTAFRDRDGEIVSTKALAADCARADQDGTYGPLRWWHQPKVDLGTCDFNAMHGRTLIESGTFTNARVAERVAAKADQLALSIGFVHPATEPDPSKTFWSIRRFERSLVPAAYPSNLYTRLVVKETAIVDSKKRDALTTLLGDPELVQTLLEHAEKSEKAADAQGVAFKAEEPDETGLIARLKRLLNPSAFKALTEDEVTADLAQAVEVAETKAAVGDDPEDIADGGADEASEDWAIGDLSPDEFAKVMAHLVQPIHDKLDGMMQSATKKAIDDSDVAVTLKATVDKQSELEAKLKASDERSAQLKAQLDELLGVQPRAIQQQRASQKDATVIADTHPLAGMEPKPDPLNSFSSWALGVGDG